jgi:hypothetical protein
MARNRLIFKKILNNRDLMRHADIQTTMQTYGGTGIDELRPVNETVVESLFGGKQ